MDVSNLQQAAVEYAELGWHVFPLSAKSKVPRKGWKEWQKRTSCNPEEVEEFWEKHPGSNIAVQLGKKSGIIDIECDSEEAEIYLVKLFGGPENIPFTPTFESRRSKHRLFKYTEELPNSDKGHWKLKTLEGVTHAVDFMVGGNNLGTYSVFPPSIHPDTGKEYKWLITPDESDIAELPEQFLANLFGVMFGEGMDAAPQQEAKSLEHWAGVSSGVTEGNRNDTAASLVGYLLRSLADPYDSNAVAIQWELVQAWNKNNRPPLELKEIKKTFDSILKRHRSKWTNEQQQAGMSKYANRDPVTGKVSESPWHLVKVLSEPIRWKLFSPLWANKSPGGFILLSTTQLRSPAKVGEQALEQAGVWLDTKFFPATWNGTKKGDEEAVNGLAYYLVENCETEEASAEEKRSYVIAEQIYAQVLGARNVGENDHPDPKGRFIRRKDGTVWFKVNALLEKLQHIAEPVKMWELTPLLKILGIKERQSKAGGKSPTRYKVFTQEAITELERMSLFSPGGLKLDEPEEANVGSAGSRYIAPPKNESATEKGFSLKGFTSKGSAVAPRNESK